MNPFEEATPEAVEAVDHDGEMPLISQLYDLTGVHSLREIQLAMIGIGVGQTGEEVMESIWNVIGSSIEQATNAEEA